MLKRTGRPQAGGAEEQAAAERMLHLQALVETGQAALSSLSLEKLCAAITERTQAAFNLDYALLYLIDERTRQAQRQASAGRPPSEAPARLALKEEGEAAASVLSQVLRRTLSEQRVQRAEEGKAAALPLLGPSGGQGALLIGGERLPQDDILEMLGAQIGAGVANARQAAVEATLLQATSPIFQASHRISASNGPYEILDILRETVLVSADYIGLLRQGFDPAGELVSDVLAYWDRDDLASGVSLPPEVRDVVGSQTIVIPNVGDGLPNPALAGYLRDGLGLMSALLVPLRGRDRTVGYLLTGRRRAYDPSLNEIKGLETLAEETAHVLDNLMLLEMLSEQTLRLNLINEMAQAVLGRLEISSLQDLVRSTVISALPVSYISMCVAELSRQGPAPMVQLDVLAGQGEGGLVSFQGTLPQRALNLGKTIRLGTRDERDAWLPENLDHLLIVPMIGRMEPLGTLNVGFRRPEIVRHEDVMLLEQVAAQASVGLENIRLMDRLQDSLEKTTSMYSTALAMNAALNIEQISEAVLQEMAKLSGADTLRLLLGGPDSREKVRYIEERSTYTAEGIAHHALGAIRYEPDETPVLKHFAQSRTNLVINDMAGDQRLPAEERQRLVEEGVSALMMVPVSTGAIWMGAVLLEARRGQQFGGEQVRLCRSVADQAALALDSQLLLMRAQQATNRERALREISERIRSARSVEEVMQVAAHEMSNVLGISAEDARDINSHISQQQSLTQNQRELIETVAAQVSLAIENLNLIENTRQAAQREQMVNTITAEIQRANSVEGVMETAVRSLLEIMEDYDVTLQLSPVLSGHRMAEPATWDGTGELKGEENST